MEDSMSLIQRWWQFVKERFEPVSSLTMIMLFLIAHFAATGSREFIVGIPLFCGTVLFFLKLRLYDEIKDYETDLVINPTRPLPRKLLKHRDLYKMIGACIVLELVLFLLAGIGSFLAASLAIAYSLLMYKEFFIGKYLRPHLTTYAISHTVVTVLLGVALVCGVKGVNPLSLNTNDMLFVLNNWFMFNIFEFGRKTFLRSEERPDVESYSKIFTPFGAVTLVLFQAIFSAFCIWNIDVATESLKVFVTFCIGIIFIIGCCYVSLKKEPWGKIYRMYSSGHIVVFYIGFIIISFLR